MSSGRWNRRLYFNNSRDILGAAPGTYACLRALGPRLAEILIRAHAEFVLEEGITYTPAQFEGRLVLDRVAGALRSFRLALPDRNPNVDVNVPVEVSGAAGEPPKRMISADIGWVPCMSLEGGERSGGDWTSSIPDEEARKRLARRFYAFAAIEWRPFEEAVRRARERRRPLHVVAVFGALDDESC